MQAIDTKQLLALLVIFGTGVAGLAACLIWQRVRDLALFLFVFCAVIVEKMNVTLFGEFWYRGTSRGLELSIVDIAPVCLLLSTLLIPRYRASRAYWPASLGLMLLYFAYCCASVWNTDPRIFGLWELGKLFRGIIVFVAAALFIRTRREVAIVVTALAIIACFQAFNGVEQRLFKGATRVPGWFDHENSLSTYLCMIGPVLVAAAMSTWSLRLRVLAGVAWFLAAGVEFMTLSRMGIPVFLLVSTCTAVACTSWKPSKEKIAIVLGAGLALAMFLSLTWPSLKARYLNNDVRAEMTDEHAFETRGVYWRWAMAMIQDHTYGVGLNNWSYAVSKVYGPDSGYKYHDYDEFNAAPPSREDAPKILLPPASDSLPSLIIGELGIPGLIVFLLFWLRWFQMGAVFLGDRLNSDPMHRIAIGCAFGALGIFLQSITEWTYKQTNIFFTCHVLMGMLASLYYARKRARRAAQSAAVEDEASADYLPTALPEPEMR